MTTRRRFLASAAATPLLRARPAAPRPNLLLVTFDQLRADCLSCYGNPVVQTPNIDRLARRGVRFGQHFSPTPQCVPSRMTIHTGRYPHTHRTLLNSYQIPDDEPTMARILAPAGYRTVCAGERPFAPREQLAGFERRLGVAPGESFGAMLARKGWAGPNLTPDRAAKIAEQKHLHDTRFQAAPVPWPEELDEARFHSDQAIQFLKTSGADPFFLHISYRRPHHPFDPVAPFDSMYARARFPATRKKPGEMANKPPGQQRAATSVAGFDPSRMTQAELDLVKSYYYGMISLSDKYLGTVLDHLDQSGLADNTIVAFLADHGEMLGDHGLMLKGGYMYDQVLHTPLILAGPGVPRGKTIDTLVDAADLAPTLGELMGFATPYAQGKSLAPLWSKPGAAHKGAVFGEFPTIKMVRTTDWKLVHYPGQRYGELYDLRKDPDEFDNLYASPDALPQKGEMYKLLADWMIRTGDPMRAPAQDPG
jgi:arylsulfatase A-like enzyme